MNKIAFGIGLVRKWDNQTIYWLTKANPSTGQLGFVMGERLEKESIRETTIREVAWALDLDRKRDFFISNMAQVNLEFVDRLPGNAESSHVIASFYNFDIFKSPIINRFDTAPNFYWANSKEICDGVADDGVRLDSLTTYLVNRSQVIQPWQSFSQNSSQ